MYAALVFISKKTEPFPILVPPYVPVGFVSVESPAKLKTSRLLITPSTIMDGAGLDDVIVTISIPPYS
jgi:hypothetical protein